MNTILLEALVSVIIFLISFGLGFIIYIKNPRSWTNKLFFILSLLIDVYIIVNYLSLHPPIPTAANQLFWIRMVMMLTSFVSPVTLLLVHTFPSERIRMKWFPLILIGILALSSGAASTTSLIFKTLEYPGGHPIPTPGPAIPLFFLDFVGLFLVSFGVLISRYRNQTDKEKGKYLYLLLGTIISFSLTSFFTVIMVVIFQNSSFVLFGPLSPVVLMAFIAYAIVKYGLFDIKIIAVEIFALVISIVLFAKIFVVGSLEEAFVDIFILVVVVILNIFLIRGVKREVGQREALQTLSEKLASANQELTQLDKTKSEFISIASHQLRTPLTSIKGYLSMILEGDFGSLNIGLQEKVSRIYQTTQRLIRIVNDLLDLTKIEQKKLEYVFTPMNLAGLLKKIYDDFEGAAKDRGLELTLSFHKELPPIIGDEDKLYHVFGNLVDNALHYTQKGSVTIETSLMPEKIIVSIKDTGIGMTPEEIGGLFTKYHRGSDVTKLHTEGAGLGLYVARQIVDDHNGRIIARSEGKEKGSTFFVELPLHKENQKS